MPIYLHRLTILKDGSDSCEQVSKCIGSDILVSSGNRGTGSGTHENPLEENEESEGETEDVIPDEEVKLVHGSNQRSPTHV